jgi:hypothetical protein
MNTATNPSALGLHSLESYAPLIGSEREEPFGGRLDRPVFGSASQRTVMD